jgi:hypothetical protein
MLKTFNKINGKTFLVEVIYEILESLFGDPTQKRIR